MKKKQIEIELFGVGVNSENRFEKFLQLTHRLKNRYYWYALKEAYQMSDNLFKFSKDVKKAFAETIPGREYLMSKRERDYLASLPEQVTIYRGMTENELNGGEFGVSWTLKEVHAEYFAFKYPRNFDTSHLKKVVHHQEVNKLALIAYFNAREEYEVIYLGERND